MKFKKVISRIITYTQKHSDFMYCFGLFIVAMFIYIIINNIACINVKQTVSSSDVHTQIDNISKSDLLAYIGTVFLGLVALYNTRKADEINKRLSEENNRLQKISSQEMFPTLEISHIRIGHSGIWHGDKNERNFDIYDGTVKLLRIYNSDKIAHKMEVFLPNSENCEEHYIKRIGITLRNISKSIISKIEVEKIEFCGVRIDDRQEDITICKGIENNAISYLIRPEEEICIETIIYFNNDLYFEFWDYSDTDGIRVGSFDMFIYLHITSISNIFFKEKIYIRKLNDTKELISYTAYEEESDNA